MFSTAVGKFGNSLVVAVGGFLIFAPSLKFIVFSYRAVPRLLLRDDAVFLFFFLFFFVFFFFHFFIPSPARTHNVFRFPIPASDDDVARFERERDNGNPFRFEFISINRRRAYSSRALYINYASYGPAARINLLFYARRDEVRNIIIIINRQSERICTIRTIQNEFFDRFRNVSGNL